VDVFRQDLDQDVVVQRSEAVGDVSLVGNGRMIPGWPYSWVAVLGPGRTSWTLPLDAVWLGPENDATEVTATQARDAVAGLMAAGHWKPGDRTSSSSWTWAMT
jgi:hypothetical protein